MIADRQGPLVSIVVCSYNAGAYLVESLRSALEQTYRHIEVLVVDDGSTDGSVDAAREQIRDGRVRWFHQPNAGRPVALNFALSKMEGEFYATQDADDSSYPRRIERQLTAMLGDRSLAAVYCGHDLIIGARHTAPTFRAKDAAACRRDIERYRMPAHDPTGMYRMSLVGDVRYEETLRVGAGYDYILRVGERWPMVVTGECLYSYRIHWESITKANPERRRRFVQEVQRRARARRGESLPAEPPPSAARPNGHRDLDNGLAAHFMESACDLARGGHRWGAVKVGLECARLHPLDLHYQKALAYAVSPQWMVRRLRPSESLNG